MSRNTKLMRMPNEFQEQLKVMQKEMSEQLGFKVSLINVARFAGRKLNNDKRMVVSVVGKKKNPKFDFKI